MNDLLSARDAIEHAIDQLNADYRDRDAIPLANAWANIAHVLFLMEQASASTPLPVPPLGPIPDYVLRERYKSSLERGT